MQCMCVCVSVCSLLLLCMCLCLYTLLVIDNTSIVHNNASYLISVVCYKPLYIYNRLDEWDTPQVIWPLECHIHLWWCLSLCIVIDYVTSLLNVVKGLSCINCIRACVCLSVCVCVSVLIKTSFPIEATTHTVLKCSEVHCTFITIIPCCYLETWSCVMQSSCWVVNQLKQFSVHRSTRTTVRSWFLSKSCFRYLKHCYQFV